MHAIKHLLQSNVVWSCIGAMGMLLSANCSSREMVSHETGEENHPSTMTGEAEAGLADPGEKKAQPAPGAKPIDSAGQLNVGPDDRCPVCAMRVDRNVKFSCGIRLKGGVSYYFCGTGCMIKTWLHPEEFLGVDSSALDIPVIREYFSGDHMDARDAIWVAGSDVVGPMGPVLVPLRNDEATLTAFESRHGGKWRFRLLEMNDERWKVITGR